MLQFGSGGEPDIYEGVSHDVLCSHVCDLKGKRDNGDLHAVVEVGACRQLRRFEAFAEGLEEGVSVKRAI